MSERCLLTGASSGIGAALARKLAARGVEVWLAARRLEALDAEVAEIRKTGGIAHSVVLDLCIANAGIGGRAKPVAEQTFADARRILETNLMGTLATILPLVPRMVKRGSGHLVGVSSLAAEIPLPAAADYGTSKAALSFFLESAAADLIPRGVDVTIVHPGFVRTPLTDKNQFKMPFLVELDEAIDIIDRGIQKKSRFIRFPIGLTAAISSSKLLPRALRDALVNKSRPAT